MSTIGKIGVLLKVWNFDLKTFSRTCWVPNLEVDNTAAKEWVLSVGVLILHLLWKRVLFPRNICRKAIYLKFCLWLHLNVMDILRVMDILGNFGTNYVLNDSAAECVWFLIYKSPVVVMSWLRPMGHPVAHSTGS